MVTAHENVSRWLRAVQEQTNLLAPLKYFLHWPYQLYTFDYVGGEKIRCYYGLGHKKWENNLKTKDSSS